MQGMGPDPLREVAELIDGATAQGIPIRLVGGQAVRFLTPAFPPREREGQDLDLASVATVRGELSRYLVERGYVADKQFNNLYGQKQLYFTSPDGARALDVMIDQLTMCHVLVFKERIARMPYTLDVTDLLLTKLQIVEMNEKDVQDIVYLLAAFPVRGGDEPGTIALDRLGRVLGEDWGWWRTVTRNLEDVASHAGGDLAGLIPPAPPFDPVAQATALREHADAAPKSLKWRLRSKVGERVRWYELPEEVAHP
ncbi:MAG TPA: hypothetical protein VEN82_06230 [Actinomycetota bacterium]|nr:hypothetical protein [Actinomycetota bacterium]